jgi:DNA-binding NarL/FixJ family response regulator
VTRPARIGIVDDHAAMVLGVKSVLDRRRELLLVTAASTVTGLLQDEPRLDLVLLDLSLADGSTPAQNLAELGRAGVIVIAYTSGERPALVRQAARAGVAGMIRKSEPPTVLVEAILQALRGEVVATADWAAAIDSDSALPTVGLTDREAEVLELYASGEKAERVAEMLFISRETVLDHIRRIRSKYATAGRAAPTKVDLYRRAREDGLLPEAD